MSVRYKFMTFVVEDVSDKHNADRRCAFLMGYSCTTQRMFFVTKCKVLRFTVQAMTATGSIEIVCTRRWWTDQGHDPDRLAIL